MTSTYGWFRPSITGNNLTLTSSNHSEQEAKGLGNLMFTDFEGEGENTLTPFDMIKYVNPEVRVPTRHFFTSYPALAWLFEPLAYSSLSEVSTSADIVGHSAAAKPLLCSGGAYMSTGSGIRRGNIKKLFCESRRGRLSHTEGEHI